MFLPNMTRTNKCWPSHFHRSAHRPSSKPKVSGKQPPEWLSNLNAAPCSRPVRQTDMSADRAE